MRARSARSTRTRETRPRAAIQLAPKCRFAPLTVVVVMAFRACLGGISIFAADDTALTHSPIYMDIYNMFVCLELA